MNKDAMKRKVDIIGIIGLLLALFTLVFGDNLYQQFTGRSFFQGSPIPTDNSSEPSILWTRNCDPRTDPDYCGFSDLYVLNEFYSTIQSINGKITYSMPSSLSDLEQFKIVVVDFCTFDLSNNELITIVKQYLELGGSAIVMGDDRFYCHDKYASEWASLLTKEFGITFTGNNESENFGEPIAHHPIAEGINSVFAFTHNYLEVSAPSQTVFQINEKPFIAVYHGKGKIVAIADLGFYWGSDFNTEITKSENFLLWKNMLGWLAK
jgi:hypothetical protein